MVNLYHVLEPFIVAIIVAKAIIVIIDAFANE